MRKLLIFSIIFFLVSSGFLAIHSAGENEPPVILSNAPPEAVVGKEYTYKIEAIDTDEDSLGYSLKGRPSGMSIHAVFGTIEWTPSRGQEGDQMVIAAVSDGLNSVNHTFIIKVYPEGTTINRLPVIQSEPDKMAVIGDYFLYQILALDAEGDNLTYFLRLAPSRMYVNEDTGSVSWLPEESDAGSHKVLIGVSDGTGETIQSFNIIVGHGNHAPKITSMPPMETKVGKRYTYSITGYDQDSTDVLTYGLEEGPVNMLVNETSGYLQWDPTKKDAGEHTVVVFVSDGRERANQTFTIKVTKEKTSAEKFMAYLPWLILVIAMIIIIPVAVILLRKRRVKTGPLPGTVTDVHERERKAIDPMEEQIIATPVDKSVTETIKDVVEEALQDLEDMPDPTKAAPSAAGPDQREMATYNVVQSVDIDDIDEEAEEEEVPQVPRRMETIRQIPTGRSETPVPTEMRIKDMAEAKRARRLEMAEIIRPRTREPKRPKVEGAGPARKLPTAGTSGKTSDQIIDEMLGKAKSKAMGAPTAKARKAAEIPRVKASPVGKAKRSGLRARAKPKGEKQRKPRFTKSQVLRFMSRLSGDLPISLRKKDRGELASQIAKGRYAKTKDGDILVQIEGKWYYGDPRKIRTYLRKYKIKESD